MPRGEQLRIFSQSEVILADKRRVYEAFLSKCFLPNDAYVNLAPDLQVERHKVLSEVHGPLLLYASQNVIFALSLYIQKFEEAEKVLSPDSEPLHPAFREAAKAHNDLILEMRRDALAWSAFAYRGKTRLPADTLEKAKGMPL